MQVDGLSLKMVEYCVCDEADRMFEMGFLEQVRELLARMSASRQTLLFSATLPARLADFAEAGLQAPQLVRLDTERRISPELGLAFFTARCGHAWVHGWAGGRAWVGMRACADARGGGHAVAQGNVWSGTLRLQCGPCMHACVAHVRSSRAALRRTLECASCGRPWHMSAESMQGCRCAA